MLIFTFLCCILNYLKTPQFQFLQLFMNFSSLFVVFTLLLSLSLSQAPLVQNYLVENERYEATNLTEVSYENSIFRYISFFLVFDSSSYFKSKFSYLDFTNCTLSVNAVDVVFEYIHLSNVLIQNTVYEDFTFTYFSAINLEERNVTRTNGLMVKSNFINVDRPGSIFTSVAFDEVNIISANYKGAKLKDVSFNNSNLQSISFQGATLENVITENANIHSISMKNAVLKNCVLNGNIEGIDLEGTTFENVYVNGQLFTGVEENESSEGIVVLDGNSNS